jgi:glycosyltransferase involved in cell wall biosynthesis
MRQIAVAHDLTQLRNYAQRGGRIERLRQRLWIFGMKRSEKVIAISDATRRDLIETGGLREDRISVIYEGFDPLIFRPASQEANPARPFLLYAGTLAPNKNLPFLLRAFVTVREAQDVDLVLVGKQEPQAVATLLANIPERLRKSVEFRGFVTDEQLALLMQQCAAFVFPSLNEGFGLAVVEAMACGAPLISSNAGSLAEVVDRGGILLDPNDSDGWTAAIDRVLRDHRFRQELSARALERSSRFSWSEAAQAYRAELIGEGRHGGV